MANRFELITSIYNEVRKDVVKSPQKWTAFLASACHNYRLPFDELLLIYAQRPDATAVLEINKWNNKFGRWVNGGAKSIAVFDKSSNKRQSLKHYFDISDTHETENSKAVPVWEMKSEYEQTVIESLENSFGSLKNKSTLIDAILSLADNITEDNISDYTDVLIDYKEDTFLSELDDLSVSSVYENLVKNSVAYMIATRLGINANDYFSREDFENIFNFNTDEAINAIGCATRDISEMAISEIAKTVIAIEKENRIIAKSDKAEYTESTKAKKEIERSNLDDRNHLQQTRTISDTESDITKQPESPIGQMVGNEENISQKSQEKSLYNSADNGQAGHSSERDSAESRADGRKADERNGSTGRLDGGTQGKGYDGLGAGNEQPETESRGNSEERGDLRSITDELPPFVDNDVILEIISNTDDDLLKKKSEIVDFFKSHLCDYDRIEFVKSIYPKRYTEILYNDNRYGYVSQENDGLLMWEGSYLSRTKESVFSWEIISDLINQLINDGKYLDNTATLVQEKDNTKVKKTAKKKSDESEQLQINLFDNFTYEYREEIDYSDNQTTLFPAPQVSQQIIDEALCLGTHENYDILRIIAYLKKDKPIEKNAKFIRETYDNFSTGFISDGQKVAVSADDNGLRIAIGDNTQIKSITTVLSWEQVSKRIRELLDLGRYCPQFILDKVDSFERSELADSIIYMARDIEENYRNQFFNSTMESYRTKSGFPDASNALADKLSNADDLATFINEMSDYIKAFTINPMISRFPRMYHPIELLERLVDLQIPPLEFKAQAGVPTIPERFISEDEIRWLLRGGEHRSDYRLKIYSLYKTEPDKKKREKAIKDYHGIGGGVDTWHDGKGITLKRGDIFEPYAKITLKWSNVEKRIGKMISRGTWLSEQDKEYMPVYEKKYIASQIGYFYRDIGDEYKKPFDLDNKHYWDSIDDVVVFLDDTDMVKSVYDDMLNVLKDMNEDDRYYDIRHEAFEYLSAYYNGTFSLFGEKREPKVVQKNDEPISSDRFFVDKEKELVEWIFFEDKFGGRYHIDTFSFNDLENARALSSDYEQFFEKISDYSRKQIFSKYVSGFDDIERKFNSGNHNFSGLSESTKNALIDVAKETEIELSKKENISPLYQSYLDVKNNNQGNIIFYQVGDFYEVMGDDAVTVANELDLVLTGRDVGSKDRIALCGFPVKSLEKHLNKLTSLGYKITASSIAQNGERIETTYTIDTDKIPVGRIDFYGSNGKIGYFTDYSDENEFLKTIKDCNEVGEPIGIVVYSDKQGNSISTKFTNDLDPLPKGFEIVPYENAMLDRAKALIDEYCRKEFERSEGADYSDLTNVDVAFTETEDGLHTIEASVDLVNYAVNINVDGKLFEQRKYEMLSVLIERELYGLDFQELTYLDDDKLKEFLKNDTAIETLENANLSDLSDASELKPKNNNLVSSHSTIRRNYNLLNEICPEIFSKKENYVKLKSGGLMPLTIEWISEDRIAVAHYYKENGDMLADPDMEFIVDVENRALTAATYQQDNLALYQNVYADKIPNVRLQKDLNLFANQWFKNIKLQRYERVYDDLEIQAEKTLPSPKTQPKPRVQTFDLHPEISQDEKHNFNLADFEIQNTGAKERFRRNINAINVLKECELENRLATPDEQKILAQYVGWGGIPEAFDENNDSWSEEFIELYTVLSPDEYEAARASTLTAFYTPQNIITAVYKVLDKLGFQKGNILEPSCAIGNFIGMLPEKMQESKVYGVELDPVSAKIARQLYQKSTIINSPFEKSNLPDSFFDVVVGNVPFGEFKVSDKKFDKYKFYIHDYFYAKSLDKVRAGGIVALITTKGTMDKKDTKLRKYIAQRADLIAAIRLPDNTFTGNAGTRITSDILVFQKRDRIIDIEPEWVQLDTDENGITMNKYFVQHPEMILGEMVMESGRFGEKSACKARKDIELDTLINNAVLNINGEITDYTIDDFDDVADDTIPADPSVQNFSYTIVDGKIYYRENTIMKSIEVSETAENRIKGMIGIRDCVYRLIDIQIENYEDEYIEAEQKKLNTLYDSFTKKYGLINSRGNKSAFSNDDSYYLLSALEIVEDGKLKKKADIFTKRTIKPHIPATHADTANEALALSIGEKACVDMEYMSELTGKDENTLFNDLQGVIFLNPLKDNPNEFKYLMADEYLSGNVREKLETAKKVSEIHPEYKVNVTALEQVQPKELEAGEISVRLGATWIPPSDINDFMYDLLNVSMNMRYYIKANFTEYSGEWFITNKSYDNTNVKVNTTYGTKRVSAFKIIETTLNLKDVRVFDYKVDEKGNNVAVLNVKETQIAQSKQELIKQAFKDWIWKEPERRHRLCKVYNEQFNCIRPREYDGSHLIFAGMNPSIKLNPHQLNAVAHQIYGGNTLLAHCVGAGKTFEMIAAAMECKRLGLCTKSMFVVPNHLIEQWAGEFLRLYPSANILVTTKKDFQKANRKRFCSRIATGNYDAVIIGHSQFEKIPVSIERQIISLEKQRDDILMSIEQAKNQTGENFTIKQLEKAKKDIQKRLDDMNSRERKDDVVTFESLGVDRLFIDESHYYKNLFLYTKMRNISGIAQSEAKKSSDLYMKCRYLDELTGGRGVIFATGTPVSNSMVELYTIQRYLQYSTLEKHHLTSFDSWASTFGETVTSLELKPEGTGYRPKTRFARFYNLPELMSMFKEVADIQTADMLNLPVPKAHFNTITTKPSDMQKEILESLAERAEAVRAGDVEPYIDNMLKITNDGRKLALDQRLVNPLLPDFEDSKINACVDSVVDFYNKGAEKKLTQLLFCDLSIPKSDNDGVVFTDVYNDIRNKLIQRGIPENEIAFIHKANTDTRKAELFAKVRNGDVRILLGSTQKMGAGTNVQDRLLALHDLDCPWRPSDLEQRSGRIIRRGNMNEEVFINRYVTENTFDAYLYQIIETKQKFISQIYTSKSPARTAEDIDETALSYAEIKMLATGNPHIKEKMELDLAVTKLKMLKSAFQNEIYSLEDKIIKFYPAEISRLNSKINGLKKDIQTVSQHPASEEDNFVGMTIFDKQYTDKKEAGLALINACKAVTNNETIPLGEYRGFKMDLSYDSFGREYKVHLKGEITHFVELGTSELGNITRLDNAFTEIHKELENSIIQLEDTQKGLADAKIDVQRVFPQEEELKQKLSRLAELDAELKVNEKANQVIDVEATENNAPAKKEKCIER